MNTAGKNILHQLTGVSSLADADVGLLRSITETYPWFGPAHLLLAKKLQTNADDDLAGRTIIQTSLYFSNPYWLHFLLTQEESLHPENATSTVNFTHQPKQEKIVQAWEENEEYPPEDETPAEHDKSRESEQRLSNLLQQHAAEFKKPVEKDTALPVKESPLYTIDYFASQGIHIESIKAGRDQLDVKVKKFTDWLKQMKTASPLPGDPGTDPETERMIETIAQNSNETRDIITEAMAEVLVKQGKTEKAVQLYQKLSFLNPDKTAYFAAKIEKIKEN